VNFPVPLMVGRLVRRYKRFLADVRVAGRRVITVHCPNTGALLGCTAPGLRVWLSRADSAARKYAHTWEIVQVTGRTLVGIHTGRANALVIEAVEAGVISELRGYTTLRREVRFGIEGSRVDLLLSGRPGECYVEVKNVTAAVDRGVALFPDAVSARGTRHLRELARTAGDGARAVVLYCVQRADVHEVRPADHIDPVYGRELRRAMEAGVEALAYVARVSPREIRLVKRVPVVCP
jgi:sugar fermentation stimulation protein A